MVLGISRFRQLLEWGGDNRADLSSSPVTVTGAKVPLVLGIGSSDCSERFLETTTGNKPSDDPHVLCGMQMGFNIQVGAYS